MPFRASGPPPKVEDFALRKPRIAPPAALAAMFSDRPLDRLNHSYGKSYADLARMWLRDVPEPPDWVAYPDDEQAIVDLLDWAARCNVAVVPYGGGSSVCGGVEPAVGGSYAGTVSLDMERLGRVLEVDRTSRAARIQAGALGPELEAQLKPHGLTLRHFPQSFEFSTLGGWIATRAGGHYAMQHTHIDDFVENTRMVTPAGVMQTRRLPGSGAGPAPDRLVLGSEGTLGVITEAWVRLQDAPRFRASASVRFDDYFKGVACVRALAQSGLNPANCRLLDPLETVFSGVGDGSQPILVLGFESADHPLQPWMARALELVRDHGGQFDAEAVARSMAPEGADVRARCAGPPHRRRRRLARRLPAHALLARSGRGPGRDHGHLRDRGDLGPLRRLLHRRQGRCLCRHRARHRQRGACCPAASRTSIRTARRPTSPSPSMAQPMAASPARWPPGATSRPPPTRP